MAQRGRKAGIEEIFKLSRDFDFLKGFSFYLNINLKHYVDISFSVSLINKTSVAGAVLQKNLCNADKNSSALHWLESGSKNAQNML